MSEINKFEFKKYLPENNEKILRYFFYKGQNKKWFCRIFYLLDGKYVHNKHGPASKLLDVSDLKSGRTYNSWFIFGKPYEEYEWEIFRKELKR